MSAAGVIFSSTAHCGR